MRIHSPILSYFYLQLQDIIHQELKIVHQEPKVDSMPKIISSTETSDSSGCANFLRKTRMQWLSFEQVLLALVMLILIILNILCFCLNWSKSSFVGYDPITDTTLRVSTEWGLSYVIVCQDSSACSLNSFKAIQNQVQSFPQYCIFGATTAFTLIMIAVLCQGFIVCLILCKCFHTWFVKFQKQFHAVVILISAFCPAVAIVFFTNSCLNTRVVKQLAANLAPYSGSFDGSAFTNVYMLFAMDIAILSSLLSLGAAKLTHVF
jgi:hypothetical protein